MTQVSAENAIQVNKEMSVFKLPKFLHLEGLYICGWWLDRRYLAPLEVFAAPFPPPMGDILWFEAKVFCEDDLWKTLERRLKKALRAGVIAWYKPILTVTGCHEVILGGRVTSEMIPARYRKMYAHLI